MNRLFVLLALLTAGAQATATTYDDVQPCDPIDPLSAQSHDFNDSTLHQLLITVETNHFTPEVERLEQGLTAPLPRDIAFVLRAFPNHYRALNAMARWQIANKPPHDSRAGLWTADCDFLRASVFLPKDATVHVIYGVYLHRAKRLAEAAHEYETAEGLGAQGADFYYNRGLLEIDLGNLDKASEYADRAYALGHPLPGLRDKLKRARAAAGRPQPAPSRAP